MSLPLAALYGYFFVAIVLDHAHLASPVALAWSKPRFRALMLRQWEWYLLLPVALVAASVLVGLAASGPNRLAPGNGVYRALVTVYIVWNAWHFGSQHYGVASLAGWRGGRTPDHMSLIVWPTMVVMLVPAGGWGPLVFAEAINFAHWTTDIGLSTRVMRRRWWAFLPAILVVGLVGFLWKAVGTHPCAGDLPVCTVVWSVPVLIGLRCGLGFVHFLYSRWVWRAPARLALTAVLPYR